MDKSLDDNPLSLDEIMDKAKYYYSEEDHQQALHWLEKAANLGYVEAQQMLEELKNKHSC